MTARPPRRLRPSPERRGEVSVDTHTALSARGEVSTAAPVAANGGKATRFVPPEVPPPAVIAAGSLFDGTGGSITAFGYPIFTTDPSHGPEIFQGHGPIADYILSTTGTNFELIKPGWYSIWVCATATGCTPGDVVKIIIDGFFVGSNAPRGYAIADSAGMADPDCVTQVFYSGGGEAYSARVLNQTATRGTVIHANTSIVRFRSDGDA